LNAGLHGRQEGYPFFPVNNPKVMETARYFDPVNFASRIKATSLVAMGFVDDVSPPAGIWTAYNEIAGPKEAVPLIDSPHNHLATPQQQAPYTRRSGEWLAALAHGDAIVPATRTTRPGSTIGAAQASPTCTSVEPVERTDPNSRAAHRQLLAKAKQGKIDVYFLGDSITRRWGCTDAQYAPMLENWRKNFFGYNAANFGWGGDTTQNILWRIQNGELDGVNPKVIVLLAGTNDIGAAPSAEPDAKAQHVAQGIEAIVDACRQKAPGAAIILTAIFPRTGNAAVMPTINKLNARLAQLCDGKRVRLLTINDKLADAQFQLHSGMMADGLHPTVAGYQVWADGLNPIFNELLGPPAHEDHAPPPTGDPSAP
jgi:lysophospholipase L1-like esterase